MSNCFNILLDFSRQSSHMRIQLGRPSYPKWLIGAWWSAHSLCGENDSKIPYLLGNRIRLELPFCYLPTDCLLIASWDENKSYGIQFCDSWENLKMDYIMAVFLIFLGKIMTLWLSLWRGMPKYPGWWVRIPAFSFQIVQPKKSLKIKQM